MWQVSSVPRLMIITAFLVGEITVKVTVYFSFKKLMMMMMMMMMMILFFCVFVKVCWSLSFKNSLMMPSRKLTAKLQPVFSPENQ